jgi:type IV pilus assembly protein PilY1
VTVSEGAGTAQFTVTLDKAVDANLTLDYVTADGTATAGSDYTGIPTTPLTIAAGAMSGTIDVSVTGDNVVDLSSETFTVDLSNAAASGRSVSIADAQGVGTITDDDGTASISIDDVTVSEDAGTASFTVTLDKAVDVDLTLDYVTADGTATAGSDYTGIPTTALTIAAGDMAGTIDVAILADSVVELDEDFYLNLSNLSAAGRLVSMPDTQAIGKITNFDSAVVSVSNTSISISEADGAAVDITVTLDRPIQAGAQVEVSYATADDTANAMADYTPVSGTLIFDNATGSYTITIPITNDQVVEPHGETFTFELTAISNSVISSTDGVSTVSIDDNDNTITLSHTAEGDISPSGSVNVEDGHSLSVNLSWTHEFQDLRVDGVSVSLDSMSGNTGVYTYTANGDDQEILAIFRHAIDVTVGANGSVAIGGTTVASGDSFIVDHASNPLAVMTPDTDFCVQKVLLGGSLLGAVTSYPLGPINESTTLEAYFRDNLLTVQIEPAEVHGTARWRVNRLVSGSWEAITGWQAHGEAVAVNCQEPNLRVEFSEVPGFIKPNNFDYQITAATTEHPLVVGTYGAMTVTLTIEVISPEGSETIAVDPTGTEEAGSGLMVYSTNDTISLVVNESETTDFYRWEERIGADTVNLGSDLSLGLTMSTDRYIIARFITPGADNDGDGYSVDEGDCDDGNYKINPAAKEICGDNINNDCSDITTDTCGPLDSDDDGDGYTENQGDCDDTDALIHPGASEVCGNSVDEDCYDGDRPCGDAAACVDIADVPLDSAAFAATANVMFILDDSGSMDWEMMTDEQPEGVFGDIEYVFDDPSNDNYYNSSNTYGTIPDPSQRRQWKSQWSGYNKIYYDPSAIYEPWPRWHTGDRTINKPASSTCPADTLCHADMDNPRADPVPNNASSGTFDLDGPYLMVYGDTTGGGATDTIDSITVQRHNGSTGTSTLADAIALVPKSVYDGGGFDPTVEIPSNSGVIIIDNKDNAFSYDASKWDDSTEEATSYDGSAIYTTSKGRPATWRVDASGDYYVFAWFNSYHSRDENAQFDVYAGGGDVHVTDYLDQRMGGKQWNPVGASYFTFNPNSGSGSGVDVEIKNAHYYTWHDADNDGATDDGEVYLVVLDGYSDSNAASGEIRVYHFVDANADDVVNDGELVDVNQSTAQGLGVWPTKADGSFMTYPEARQNFADWYMFYRRRELTTKAAVGRVIESMRGINVGLYSIQERIKAPVVPIDVDGQADQTSYLLDVLYYEYWSSSTTPLRNALKNVGEYFHMDDGKSGGITGKSPYYPEEDGGGCQKAFAILMTDGYYNGNPPTPSIGNVDGDGSTNFDTGLNDDNTKIFADSESDSLADVAMLFYENDLAAGLSDFVPPVGYDTARHQHMVTYGVAFGVHGSDSRNPDNFPNCLPDCGPDEEGCHTQCPEWPTIIDSNEEKIDDLYHATVNGRGKFLSANSPVELVDALMAIMADIENQIRSGTAVAINAQELSEDTAIYQAIYNAEHWKGDLISRCLDKDTGDIVDCSGGIVYGESDTLVNWSANQQLEARAVTTDSATGDDLPSRQIITYTGTAGTDFTYDGLTTDQKNLFGADEATQRAIVNFLRGSASREARNGGTYRNRYSLLGDFVHSAPHLVKLPGTNGSFEPSGDASSDDERLLFVGGNDGMLHAFNAEDGEELFAYVPNEVFKSLKKLSDPYYTHRYYVDNAPFSARVNDRTLVVGGLGKGGKGIYCLDVTSVDDIGAKTDLANSILASAETHADKIVKWEFPGPPPVVDGVEVPDPDMGYTFSQTYIVNSRAGHVVIFGNGYESTNGHAVLFVLNTDGTELTRIDTGVGSGTPGDPTGNTECNGLSTPALIDVNYDGKVDYAYAGDLLGNLWKFDLTDADPANWKVSYNTNADGSGDPKPLFQAINKRGKRQPITSRPDVMIPCDPYQNGYLVVVSTGRYLGSDDFADITVKSVYGVWDWQDAWGADGVDKYLGYLEAPGTNEFRSLSNVAQFVAADYADKLTFQEQRQVFYDGDNGYRVLSDNPLRWASVSPTPSTIEHLGWYFDFPGTGERGTQDIVIRGGYVILITQTPDASPCSTGGSSILHVINACTGGRINYAAILDISGTDGSADGVLDQKDLINIGTEADPMWVAPSGLRKGGMWYTPAIISLLDKSGDLAFSATSEGSIEKLMIMSEPTGLYYWREIN